MNISEPNAFKLAPSFDEPIEMLEACHDKVRHFCHQLSFLPQQLRATGVNAQIRSSIEQIMRYFDIAAPLHHADEEENLFPEILKHCPEFAPLIERLVGQHLELQHDWLKIREQLIAVHSGKYLALSERRVMNFARRYRLHASDEEEFIFAQARQKIPADILQNLGKIMRERRQTPPKIAPPKPQTTTANFAENIHQNSQNSPTNSAKIEELKPPFLKV